MAKLPIEIVSVNQIFEFSRELNEAVEIANSLQQ
jgi:hypothetical protein